MNIEDVKEIKIMKYTVGLLRIPCLFPTNKVMNDPNANIYIKFLLVNLSTIYYSIGAALHMIMNIRKGVYDGIDKDIANILSYHGASYFLFRFLLNLKTVLILYKQFSDFKTFGKPNNFEERNNFLNKLSRMYVIYHTCVVSTMVSAALLYIPQCKKTNVEKHLNEVCGMPVPTWLPFDFDYFPVKQLVHLYEAYSVFVVYQTAGILSFCMMETLEHLVVRFEHVADTYVEALAEQDKTIRRQKFYKAVKYHQTIIEMGTLLNECFRPCMMVHISMTGPFIGVAGYTFLTQIPLDSCAVLVGWTISTYIVCHGGQRLMESSTLVGKIIHRIDWYDLEPDIQRDLVMIILRSSRPIYLRAGPFGAITYSTAVTILKTSYSYVTLLKQTM